MTDLTLHDDIDRLDTGITRDPDVSGIISAARRRRRRTRAIMTVGGLATAAVVAPLALLVGGGAATAPSAPGFASGSSAAPTADEVRSDDMVAAVVEAFPSAASVEIEVEADIPGDPEGRSIYLDDLEGFRLGVTSATDGQRFGCDPTAGCPQVGDWQVAVLDGGPIATKGEDEWMLWVQVTPVDPERTENVEVIALVNASSQKKAEAMLPSVESLTALALDERLAPPTK